MLPSALFVLLAALLSVVSACGPRSRHDFPWVSGQVEQRTGHGLRDPVTPEAAVPEGVTLDDGLSQEEAVALALWNSPTFLEALAELGFARSALIQAGLLTNPVFSVLFPLGPKQLEFALKQPVEALWLRPKRVAAARLDAQQVAERLVQGGLDVARDAKMKWTELHLARERVALADEGVEVARRVGVLTEARLSAGDVSALDVAGARADALAAEDEVVRLRQDEVIAEQRLRSFTGLRVSSGSLRLEEPVRVAALSHDVAALVDLAFAARPDLRAAELTVQAAGERAGLSRWEVLSLAGIADAKHETSKGLLVGPGLEVGIPIFDHNQAGMAHADAEVVRAVRAEAAMRDRIALEVHEAAARYEQARGRSELLDMRIVPELERFMERAERAWAAGETSRLESLAARSQLLRARARQADAAAELSSSRAELERSIGSRLDVPERNASR
jgi:cobalt-zinc-cadmium efflux system outer membrane protein